VALARDPSLPAAYVYADALSQHVLAEGHPMRPVRLAYTTALARAYGALDGPGALVVPPRPATVDELLTFHEPAYVDAVRRLSACRDDAAERFGFARFGDNPVHVGMYEAALLSTGASVVAAELVAGGRARAAFSPAGGLHHAMPARASGFCIFNDPVIAINALRARGLRVAYVDIDAHHGDGVQHAYYADPDVLTVSVHEGPRWLFPGTGEVAEMGIDAGYGFSVNLPLAPYTPDEVYLRAFDAVVPPLLEAFKPDVLATQLGADAYVGDPLTHLALSARGYETLVTRFAALGLPWLAFGGGGYDLDAVPRLWTLAYAHMRGVDLPDDLPAGAEAFVRSLHLRDGNADVDDELVAQAEAYADAQVAEVRRRIFPLHGLA
jgi:acetoin utilization protein AcuC